MLYPVPSKASKLAGVIPNLADTVEKEHKRLLARKSIIEKRKEDQERQQLEMVVTFPWLFAQLSFYAVPVYENSFI